MTYRIIQWGTGSVGRQALRTILERPDFELAAVRVYNPEKVGVDAGDLIGRDPTGVRATDDVDAILATDADCVCYTALGSTLPDHEQQLDDVCRLLASGKNVVSSAVEHQAYLRPDFQLPGAGSNALARLEDACQDGGTTFFHAGINPGFSMDAWPITMSRLCRRIDRITTTEIVDMTGYTSEHMVREIMGFGKPADASVPLDSMVGNVKESAFIVSMRMLADAIGIDLDEVRYSRETATTDVPFEIQVGDIDAGTVAAMKFRFDGFVRGREIMSLQFVWRISNDIAPQWPTGDSRWLLSIEGDPDIFSEIMVTSDDSTVRTVSLSVATLLLNAVPVVCRARPGLLNNLNIPPHGGGHVVLE